MIIAFVLFALVLSIVTGTISTVFNTVSAVVILALYIVKKMVTSVFDLLVVSATYVVYGTIRVLASFY